MGKSYFSNPPSLSLVVLLIGLLLVCTPGVFANENPGVNADRLAQTVSGTIKDASNGIPLAGATISVKGGNETTDSDSKGAFTISVPGSNSILLISYVGYVTQELPVGTNTQLDISLQPSSADLAQVVVVGYGTQNKRDVTGAVKSVKAEAFNKGIINTPQELLQGKVAGVNVTSASGEPGGILGYYGQGTWWSKNRKYPTICR